MLTPDILYLSDCCSENDMGWMHRKAKEIAKEKGARFLATYTLRTPKAFIRSASRSGRGIHLDLSLSRYLANGRFYWFFIERID